MARIRFLTGNRHKLREAQEILEGHEVVQEACDLDEIQSLDPRAVIAKKLAAAPGGGIAMVEDTCLWIGETGLPGPFIKWFLETIGRDGLATFADAFGDAARAECHVGLRFPDGKTRFFVGTTHGRIVQPMAESPFGWDPLFLPDGHEKTYAEMSAHEKNAISHRRKALQEVAAALR